MPEEQRFFFLDLRPAGVDGGCEKIGHKGWLELDNWDFSMNQEAEPNVKGGRPMKTQATGRFSFTIKHNGPQIFKNVTSGAFIDQPVTFEAERGGLRQAAAVGSKPTGTYFRLVFNHLVVSGRSLSGDDGQKTESVELSFQKVEMTYRQVVNGQLGPPLTKSFDCKTYEAL